MVGHRIYGSPQVPKTAGIWTSGKNNQLYSNFQTAAQTVGMNLSSPGRRICPTAALRITPTIVGSGSV